VAAESKDRLDAPRTAAEVEQGGVADGRHARRRSARRCVLSCELAGSPGVTCHGAVARKPEYGRREEK
jgi:hypothetical protein